MDFSRYSRFLGTPGVPRLFASMLVGRLPGAMLGLAIVLRVTGAGGSYALAGAVTAAYAITAGVSSPVLSRLVDRRGQTVVLVPTSLAMLGATVLFAALSPNDGWLLLLAGGLIGLVLPPITTSSRALWPSVVTEADALESAYTTDATFQELIFIVGPLLVVAVNVPFGSAAAIIAAGVVCASGTLSFALSAHSRNWRPAPHVEGRNHALRSPGIRVLIVTLFALILGFSAIEVSVVAAAKHAGHGGVSGVLLALWSLGSLLAGFVYGSRSWRGNVAQRLTVLLTVIVVVTAAMAPSANLFVLALLLMLNGANCAPAFSNIYLTAQRVAVPGAVTESYAWLSAGTMVGAALGSALAGVAINQHGAGGGFAIATIGTVVALGSVVASRHVLSDDAAPARRLVATGS
ncbi:MAG TPA: MFS transporter [Acidothermaceae bacterium]|nr:MFS transporter [Acidothermaceae bacterium]